MESEADARVKRCPRCQMEKPLLANFHKNRAQKDGFSPYCKICNKATQNPSEASKERSRTRSRDRMRRLRETEPDRVKKAERLHYERHRDAILQRDAKYRAENLDVIRARARAYHAANRDRNNARRRSLYVRRNEAALVRAQRAANRVHLRNRARLYRKNNPEKMRFWDKAKFVKRKLVPGKYSSSDLRAQYQHQNGRCYWCSYPVGQTWHCDHVIPLSRGGTNWPDNIVVSCPTCNLKKYNLMPAEWLKRLREINAEDHKRAD